MGERIFVTLAAVAFNNGRTTQMKTYLTVSAAMLVGIAVGSFAVQGLNAQGKAPVYLISEIDVTNPEAYGKEFAPKAQATVKASNA